MTERTNPKLWEKIKSDIMKGDRGGNAGEWSARKAQLAVLEYKKQGGGYIGNKKPYRKRIRGNLPSEAFRNYGR